MTISNGNRVNGRTRLIPLMFALIALVAGALALAPATARAEDAAGHKLTLTLERTDNNGETVYVGDTLMYTITYTNATSDETLTAYPTGGTFDNILVRKAGSGWYGGARYGSIKPGAQGTCTFAAHVVTYDDMRAGTWTPKAVFAASRDTNGTDLAEENITVTGDTVTVAKGQRPVAADDATNPTVREDGEGLKLTTPDQYGVKSYRIPAIAEGKDGRILVAYDARPNDGSDAPQPNSIWQRVSDDGGKSFKTRTIVAQGLNLPNTQGCYGFSDPSYVVDRETGDIFCFFVLSYNLGFFGSAAGTDPTDRGILHAAYVKSTDNGDTWTVPQIITKDITPNTAWTSRFASSGAGIQLKYGEHKGRLLQQYAIQNGSVIQAVTVYSDDHGATWQAGTPVGTAMDENKVVELSDGSVMLNSRPNTGSYRRIAISKDGGATYGNVYEDKALPDPRCNAQVTRAFPNAAEGSAEARVLLYSSCSASGRKDGIVRISYDDGRTWAAQKQFKAGYMSYSVITALSDAAGGGYGIAYEADNNDITFTRVSLKWLDDAPATMPVGIDEWAERNQQTDDYKKLSEKLQSPDQINWLFIGDSITQGVQHTQGYRTFSEHFANHLKTTEVRGVSRANDLVMNTGISSADATWPLREDGAFDKWVTDKHPDVVFIAFGMNDGRFQQFPRDTYIKNLKTIIEKVRGLGAIPILMTQNYTTDSGATNAGTFNGNLDNYFAAERLLAFRESTLLVDFNLRWLELNGGNRTGNAYMGAGNNIHPGENGHVEWARFILSALDMIEPTDPLAVWDSSIQTLVAPGGTLPSAKDAGFKGVGSLTPTAAAAQAVGKVFSGAQYLTLGDDAGQALAGKTDSNVTVRFRAQATGQPQTLFSVSDGAGKRMSVRLTEKGFVQFYNSDKSGDYYTKVALNLADGTWHTLSVNMAAKSFTFFVDGTGYAATSVDRTDLNTPANMSSAFVTLGAIRDANTAEDAGKQFIAGMIDYAAVYSRALTDDEAKALTAETPAAATADAVAGVPVETVEAASTAVKAVISDYDARKNLVFAGGVSLEGGYVDGLIGKNTVELLDELVRWEYAGQAPSDQMQTARAKYFVNVAKAGQTVKQLDEGYEQRIGQYNPALLFVQPDILDAAGELAEADKDSFKASLESLVDKAKADGASVILITPLTTDEQATKYVEAMKAVAADKDVPLVDAQDWITKVLEADSSLKAKWFDTAGVPTYAGNLGFARFLNTALGIPGNPKYQSRILGLTYDQSTGFSITGADEDGGTVEAARGQNSAVTFSTSSIDPDTSLVMVASYRLYEVHPNGARTLVRDGITADDLKAGLRLENVNKRAHTYEIVGSSGSAGSMAPTVTYTATLAGVPVTGVAVKSTPTKTLYKKGAALNPAGLVLSVTYDDGTTEEIAYDRAIASAFSFDKTKLDAAGTATVTVTYENKTATFSVRAYDMATAKIASKGTSMRTSTDPSKQLDGMRYGFDLTLPEGVTEADVDWDKTGWAYGTDKDKLSFDAADGKGFQPAMQRAGADGGRVWTSNIVFTGIPAAQYKTDIHVKARLVLVNGDTLEAEGVVTDNAFSWADRVLEKGTAAEADAITIANAIKQAVGGK